MRCVKRKNNRREQVKLGVNASSWREARESVFSSGTCFCFGLVNFAVFFSQSHGVIIQNF